MPTPVSDGKLLYVVRDNGVVFALDVKTGATVYGPVRLPSGTYSASPILADGKIYVTTEEEGLTTVFRAGPKFEIMSSNSLLERLRAVLPEHGRRFPKGSCSCAPRRSCGRSAIGVVRRANACNDRRMHESQALATALNHMARLINEQNPWHIDPTIVPARAR